MGLVASIGHFIPGRIIEQFPMGMLNAHPSLLPRFRGASPIQYTIMNGDITAGVSIIDVDPTKFDAGKIWMQREIHIEPYSGFKSLESTLAKVSGEMFHTVLSDYETFKANRKDQEGPIVYAPKITRADAEIKFTEMTAKEIWGRYQAFQHQEKLHATLAKGLEVTLIELQDPTEMPIKTMPRAQLNIIDETTPPGATYYEKSKKVFWIKCKRGWLGATLFRMQNRPFALSGGAFNNDLKLSNFKQANFI